MLKKHSIITVAKAPYKYTKNKGEVVKIDVKALAKDMKTDAELREELYQKIAEVMIMKYKSPDSEIREDVEVDASEDAEEVGGGDEE